MNRTTLAAPLVLACLLAERPDDDVRGGTATR